MRRLLHIDCSVAADHSVTRKLSQAYVDAWLEAVPDGQVIRRDLVEHPPSHFSPSMSVPSDKSRDEYSEADHAAMAESDMLIGEIEQADEIIIGTPMYNYSVPSSLKAWIDQIVIAPRAFHFDFELFDGSLVGTEGSKGAFTGKRLVVAVAKGCDYTLPQNKRFDQIEPYLRVVFEFIGITDAHFVHANAARFSPPDQIPRLIEDCKARLVALAHEGAARE